MYREGGFRNQRDPDSDLMIDGWKTGGCEMYPPRKNDERLDIRIPADSLKKHVRTCIIQCNRIGENDG